MINNELQYIGSVLRDEKSEVTFWVEITGIKLDSELILFLTQSYYNAELHAVQHYSVGLSMVVGWLQVFTFSVHFLALGVPVLYIVRTLYVHGVLCTK